MSLLNIVFVCLNLLNKEKKVKGVILLVKKLAIVNQKGGVGKSTTAVNLGASLAELGHKVLLIDVDPQGNATSGLGLEKSELEYSIYDILIESTPLEEAIFPTNLDSFFILPANIDLAGAEIELVSMISRESRLKNSLKDYENNYDFILFDCPPSLGLLTLNALSATHKILVPIQCEYYALEGLGQLIQTIKLVKNSLNSELEIEGVVLTMYDARTNLSQQVIDEVKNHFENKVYETIIPRNVRLSEAPSFGQPITEYASNSKGAKAYRNLAKEVRGNV
jgi:chromosome partitioning protein